MKISEREVLRYLGYRGNTADARLSKLIGQLTDELTACVRPKSVYGLWECGVAAPFVDINGVKIKSEGLAGHLEGCGQVVLFAATLGIEADGLIRRYSVRNMEKAVAAGAVCAAMIEACCDEIEDEIRNDARIKGLCLTTRFSPGYGDFDIAHQRDMLAWLNCGKRMGLTLTDGYMLTPSKSVTAVMGLSEGTKRAEGKCGGCTNRRCEFREAT